VLQLLFKIITDLQNLAQASKLRYWLISLYSMLLADGTF